MQQAIYRVAMYGEARADRRQAISTAHLMLMQATEKVSDAEYRELVKELEDYLPTADDFEDVADLEILKKLKGLAE